jgi:hypothetical protein
MERHDPDHESSHAAAQPYEREQTTNDSHRAWGLMA